jgi:hypothetical protein
VTSSLRLESFPSAADAAACGIGDRARQLRLLWIAPTIARALPVASGAKSAVDVGQGKRRPGERVRSAVAGQGCVSARSPAAEAAAGLR